MSKPEEYEVFAIRYATLELADAPELVVPGHDPLVMERYAAPEPALKGIVVRLDEKPKAAA